MIGVRISGAISCWLAAFVWNKFPRKKMLGFEQ